jgi:GNAT superfamily N-acetyltransferase
MTKIDFRSAVLFDLPVLYEFEQGLINAERPFDPTLKSDPINYYDIRAMIESSDTEVIVALINDELVASAYVKVKEAKPYLQFDHYAYVGFMFVKPEFRGKGISQQLIAELINWAKSRNLNELRLDVYDDNQNAVRAYEKCGFKKHLVEMRMKI